MHIIHLGIAIALATGQGDSPWHDDAIAPPPIVPSIIGVFAELPRAPWVQSDSADSLYSAGVEAINASRFRDAADLFQQITTRYPKSTYAAEALYWRAFALYRLGEDNDLNEGLKALSAQREQFLKTFLNGDAAALEQRILGELARRGDPKAAQSVADKARELVPSAPDSSQRAAMGCDTSNAGVQNNDVKIAALNALVQMNPERALPTLQELLTRQDEGSVCLRRTAVLLLAQQRADGVETTLLNAARSDPDLEVRKQAVLYLSQFNTERSVSALDSIVRTANEPELIERAVIALSQSEDPRAHQALRAFAGREDVSKETRRKVIRWLVERPSAENATFLRELYGRLDPTDVELRRTIVQAVSQTADSATGRWLLEIAHDDTDTIDLRLRALVLGAPMATTEDLVTIYAPTLETPLRVQLLEIYAGRSQQAAVLDVLGEIAKHDPNAELRRKAVSSISQSPDPHAAQVLQNIVKEQ